MMDVRTNERSETQEGMEEEAFLNRLAVQIGNKVSGYNKGYFVTVDSPWTTDNCDINRETLYRFGNNQLKNISDDIHVRCFGYSPSKNKRKLRTVASIEIGPETNRLHAHMMILHHGETDLTSMQIIDHMPVICGRNMNMWGKSAFEVKPFDLKREWIPYFVKSTPSMMSKYGFMNIECY